jgi:hypothetical protein
MHKFLVNNGIKVSQIVWRLKIPPEIKKKLLLFIKKGIFSKKIGMEI